MTHQLDMMPDALVDPAVLERIEAKLPKARAVPSRFPLMHIIESDPLHHVVMIESVTTERLSNQVDAHFRHDGLSYVLDSKRSSPSVLRELAERFDVGHELVLPERARKDHR